MISQLRLLCMVHLAVSNLTRIAANEKQDIAALKVGSRALLPPGRQQWRSELVHDFQALPCQNLEFRANRQRQPIIADVLPELSGRLGCA